MAHHQFMSPLIAMCFFFFTDFLFIHPTTAQLRQNYYADICPNAETIVRNVVTEKFRDPNTSPSTIAGAVRLVFHDCFVEGCDASITVKSTDTNKAEKEHPDNLSIAGDGFDTVNKAKAAIDENPGCKNKVSCADIIVMAARDAIALAGGPSYAVELGRLDGLSSTAASAEGKLPHADFNLDQPVTMFGALGLSQTDMIALSGAHTVGFSHCSNFVNRIYNFSHDLPIDPALNQSYALELRKKCFPGSDPGLVLPLDRDDATAFNNMYFKNMQQHQGLLSSDQVLYTDLRSMPTVNNWAEDSDAFAQAFVTAITKMGRVGVKTGSQGNIRADCSKFN